MFDSVKTMNAFSYFGMKFGSFVWSTESFAIIEDDEEEETLTLILNNFSIIYFN